MKKTTLAAAMIAAAATTTAANAGTTAEPQMDVTIISQNVGSTNHGVLAPFMFVLLLLAAMSSTMTLYPV